MAWNEPGGNNQDPWGGRKNNDGPPDLDEALKKFQDRINDLFGAKGGSGYGGGGSGSTASGMAAPFILLLILFAGWFFWKSVYIIDAKEKAVVLQLGVFKKTVGEGFHIIPALINHVEVINTTEIQHYDTNGLMLTEDESIVEMPVTVQYNILDPKAYYLNVKDPEISLKHATDSALRHVVGSSNQVLGEGRNKLKVEMQKRLKEYLNSYGTGINIVEVNIRKGEPPEAVKAAFDDVIEAKENEERFKNEAQAYANAVVPEARGKAQRTLEEASAYRDQVIAKAEGEAERFNQLLAEYKKAPQVTRERLYIDAIESVMAKSSKVMVDVEGGNNMLYLPLDKIIGQSAAAQEVVRSNGADLSPRALRELTNQVVEELRRSQAANSSRRGGR